MHPQFAMRLDATQLMHCHVAACRSIPLLIVGAGRWGRVWLDVVSAARGSADALAVVARHGIEEFDQQFDGRHGRPRIFRDYGRGLDWLGASTKPRLVLIASRPASHFDDAMTALAHADAVYVEKPLTADTETAAQLQTAFVQKRKPLLLGTEFALHPAFHFVAEYLADLGAEVQALDLVWCDPPSEPRHGAVKRRHPEVSLLDDVHAHAFSVFQIFVAPTALWPTAAVSSAHETVTMHWRSAGDVSCTVRASWAGRCRERCLIIRTRCGRRIEIDFARHPATCLDTGKPLPLAGAYAAMPSTLRLALGLMVLRISGEWTDRCRPLEDGLGHLVDTWRTVRELSRG